MEVDGAGSEDGVCVVAGFIFISFLEGVRTTSSKYMQIFSKMQQNHCSKCEILRIIYIYIYLYIS